jgi:hypothetical protein
VQAAATGGLGSPNKHFVSVRSQDGADTSGSRANKNGRRAARPQSWPGAARHGSQSMRPQFLAATPRQRQPYVAFLAARSASIGSMPLAVSALCSAAFERAAFRPTSGYDPTPPTLARHISERIWCGRRDSNPHSQRETDFLTTSAFAAASRRSWPGLSLRHGLSAEGAARPVSTPSLNRGLGSGLAWGSSPLAFPDFERFCSTNFPVGTPIGSLLRLPISPRPLCHISAITRFGARWRIFGQFQHLAPVRLLATIP